MTNHNQPPTSDQPTPHNPTTKDPVCGMDVVPERAAGSAEHLGKTYYFCSKNCVQKFQADPERFLRAPASAPMPTHAPLVQVGGIKPMSRPAPAISPTSTPVQLSSRPAGSQQTPAASYICPMDPEVREARPGSCPKCGMALEPEFIGAAPQQRTEYVCPLHPQIVPSEPGFCPICGMALEPRSATVADGNAELRG